MASSRPVRSFLYNNGLSLVAGGFFVMFMVLQFFSGYGSFIHEQEKHGIPDISHIAYLIEPHFWSALFENWESEFLQMGLLVVASEKLRQKGSAQSRKLKDEEAEEEAEDREIEEQARLAGKSPGPVKVGGWRLKIYNNSLLLAFLTLFVLSFVGHITASFMKVRAEELQEGSSVPSFFAYAISSDFWFESMQNWQSEFLAMFSIVVLSIWLRAKGSAESKPVGAAHDYTGT